MESTNLIIKPEQEAVFLNERIRANGQAAVTAVCAVGKDLRRMKAEGLFKYLGYETFEEYAEQEHDLKRRQAYQYISVYENLGETFVQSNAQLGITKLSLLTQINKEDRAEVMKDNDLAGMTVNEVKELLDKVKLQGEQLSMFEEEKKKLSEEAESDKEFYVGKIEELKKLNDKLRNKLQTEEEKFQKSEKEASKAAGRLSIVQTDYDMAQEYISKIQKENQKLKKEIEELESKPVDVAVPEPIIQEIVKEVPDKKALAAKDREYEALQKKYEELEESRSAEADKIKREMDGLRSEYEKKLSELKTAAENAGSDKNSFKAVYTEAYKSFSGLISFISDTEDGESQKLYIEKTSRLITVLSDELKKFGI